MKTIPEKYHAHIEMIVSTARGFLAEGGDLQAMAFLGKFGEGVVPLPVDMGHKDRSAMMIREICKVTRPDYVMMISEAWMRERKEMSKEEMNEYLKSYTGLKDHPDRIDAVFLTLETQEGLWFGHSRIKIENGKRGFDDLQFELTKKLEGRFSTFLPREGMTH
jgi:hypothetical protein